MSEKLYYNLTSIGHFSEKEQMMVIGGNKIGNCINIDSSSFKWFTDKEILFSDEETVEIDEKLVMKSIMDVANNANNVVVMIHSHPCKSPIDKYVYGILSDSDLENARKLLPFCESKNLYLYDGVITGNQIYFWDIDNSNDLPMQIDCYVDGKLMNNRLPSVENKILDTFASKK